MNDSFQVSPIKSYTGASYPKGPGLLVVSEGDEPERSFAKRASAIIMSALALLFLSSCYRQPEALVATSTPVLVSPQRPVVIALASRVECSPGAIRCRDQSALDNCQGGAWVARSCADLCRERYGEEFISNGCAPGAADPCQCVPDPNYGMLDGEMIEVEPSEL